MSWILAMLNSRVVYISKWFFSSDGYEVIPKKPTMDCVNRSATDEPTLQNGLWEYCKNFLYLHLIYILLRITYTVEECIIARPAHSVIISLILWELFPNPRLFCLQSCFVYHPIERIRYRKDPVPFSPSKVLWKWTQIFNFV